MSEVKAKLETFLSSCKLTVDLVIFILVVESSFKHFPTDSSSQNQHCSVKEKVSICVLMSKVKHLETSVFLTRKD